MTANALGLGSLASIAIVAQLPEGGCCVAREGGTCVGCAGGFGGFCGSSLVCGGGEPALGAQEDGGADSGF